MSRDDDTRPIARRSGHSSGLHEKVAGLKESTTTQLDRIERNLERSLGELRELDRHLVELRVTLEGVSRRIDEVRAEHDRRLDQAAAKHGALVERVSKLEAKDGELGERVSKLETNCAGLVAGAAQVAEDKSAITVRGAATLTGAGAVGAGVLELIRFLSGLVGG